MSIFEVIYHTLTRYYGVDWLVTVTVFLGVFLLGDKRRAGFLVGMISAFASLVFSFQVGSVANGVTSVVLFVLYARGYAKWRHSGVS